MKNSEIYRPCKTCAYEDTCELKMGCRQWKGWFREYWAALRRNFAR